MPASDSLSLEDGMRTVSWAATDPLRIRVSMSAMGSVMVMGGSPTGLRDARHLAGVHHLAQADPAKPECAVDGARPPAAPAAGVGPHPELGLALLLLDQCLLRQNSLLLSYVATRGGRGSRRRRATPSPQGCPALWSRS